VTVSQRLYLAVVPGIVGVFLVAGLAYWGHFGRRAPNILILICVVASVGSLAVAWRNTRYVATRVSRLAVGHPARLDELDTIEDEVGRLRRTVAEAIAAQARAEATADQRVRQYAELIDDAATAVVRQLDEVRIPLHILLESHFGDLNENQEEMLAAARTAADDVHTRLDRLRAIADVDRGALRLRPERVRVGDIIGVLLPSLKAAATHANVSIDSDISPLQPAAIADRAWLSEALSLLANDAVRRTPAGGEVRLTSVEPASPGQLHESAGFHGDAQSVAASHPVPDRAHVQLAISHGEQSGRPIDIALADRLIAAQGGRVEHDPKRTLVTLPVDPAARVSPDPLAGQGGETQRDGRVDPPR
jgi:two-component system, OmpR family, sensor histidine kinase BaeS